MQILNNFQGINEELLAAAFPWATVIIKPLLVEEEENPERDFINAFCVDSDGVLRYSGTLIKNI